MSGACSPVISTVNVEPPIASATASSSSPAPGTSRHTTWAPSRASTCTIAFPIPRPAPVTSAVRSLSGRSQSIVAAAGPPPAIRTTCPDTYADFGDSRNRSVDSIRPV